MKHLKPLFTFAAAGFLATSLTVRAEDPIPPKPPGSSSAPAATTPSATTPDAGTPGGKGQAARVDMLQRLKEQLDLTPEQVEKLKPVLEKQREKFQTLKDDASLSQEQKRDKAREIFMGTIEEIKPILTEEQLAKLKETLEKRRAERQKAQ